MPGLQLTSWYGIATPVGVRGEIIERLHRYLTAAMQSLDVKQRLAKVGMDSTHSTSAECGEHIKREVARWTKVIIDAKIQVE